MLLWSEIQIQDEDVLRSAGSKVLQVWGTWLRRELKFSYVQTMLCSLLLGCLHLNMTGKHILKHSKILYLIIMDRHK